jgi:hypothetical protein
MLWESAADIYTAESGGAAHVGHYFAPLRFITWYAFVRITSIDSPPGSEQA